MKKTELLIATIILVLVASMAWAGVGPVSVGLTPVTVVAATGGANSNKWVVLQNNSTNDMYLKLDSSTNTLTTTNGVKLAAGASIAITATAPANPARNAIQAVSAAGTNSITVSYGNEGQ